MEVTKVVIDVAKNGFILTLTGPVVRGVEDEELWVCPDKESLQKQLSALFGFEKEEKS